MKKSRWIWAGLVLLGAPLVIFGVKGVQILRSIGGGNPIEGWQGLQNPRSQFPGRDRVTLLVIGKDYSTTRQGIQYTKESRADTIMLVSADLVKREISAVSIPRDLRVTAPDGQTGKINATYRRGGDELLVGTIDQLFDVHIDYTVALKPDAVREVVDSLGGVEVTTLDFMKYDDNWGNLHIDLPAGTQWINGEQAVGFSRFREVNLTRMDERGRIIPLRNVKRSKEEGDLRRTERQQQLLRAMVASALRPQNMLRADQVLDTGFSQIDTNLKRIQLTALATIFRSGVKHMHTATLDTTPQRIGRTDYLVLNEKKSKAIVDWLIKGDDKALNRALTVAVYNGTNTPGVARSFGDRLRRDGYQVVIGGNTPAPVETSTIFFAKAAHLGKANEIGGQLGGSATKKFAPGERPLKLIPQADLLVVIGADRASGLVSGSGQARPRPGRS